MKSVAIIKVSEKKETRQNEREGSEECKAMEKGNQFETNTNKHLYGIIMNRVSNGNTNEAQIQKQIVS